MIWQLPRRELCPIQNVGHEGKLVRILSIRKRGLLIGLSLGKGRIQIAPMGIRMAAVVVPRFDYPLHRALHLPSAITPRSSSWTGPRRTEFMAARR